MNGKRCKALRRAFKVRFKKSPPKTIWKFTEKLIYIGKMPVVERIYGVVFKSAWRQWKKKWKRGEISC